ncbi:GNAT family N-acetyltransferase [Brevundimonas subvibrioides]|uniref:GNAT family N-acetyltransferase n=1 Tax=Brevundimonas subvibrioides TaxID=74313 RepID=UPI0022B349C4|nr:N-acetyltransferase [Brevundimonas subvibrioides]
MSASLATVSVLRIVPEIPADVGEVDRLVLEAFGPGRFAKTAERIRERARLAAGYVAREDGRLVGSVRLWAIRVGGVDAVFLGPIAVAAEARDRGLGADLVGACMAQAQSLGVAGVLLVGDLSYFSRFGFEVAPDVKLAGPVDPKRLLWLNINASAPQGLALPA